MKFIKYFLLATIIGIAIATPFAYKYYNAIFKPNVPSSLQSEYLHIPTGSTFDEIVRLLKDQNFIIDEPSFRWVAVKMSYKKADMRTGRFRIQPNWSNRALVGHLRNGKQAPVNLVISTGRLPEDMASIADRFLEVDSVDVIRLLSDRSFLSSEGYTPETAMSLFIPNTYQFFWNTGAKGFFERMKKEHKIFWEKEDRLAKAKKLNMTPQEVYTLASIVERESQNKSERPTIAGLYLNRIKKGMKLDADPTVVFATRQFDLRRVLNKHLKFDSPYNTYLYKGLPPGPISLASISSIDAVLNSEDHDYIFMCAYPGNEERHAFAETIAGHNINARKYRRWLNQQGIR